MVLGTFGYGRVLNTAENYGFDGIAVALVGGCNAIGIFFAGLLFGLLKVAQPLMQSMQIPKDIATIISSTIISHDGTLADGLSTSLFIMGVDDALDYWRAHSDEFDAILMDENGTVYVTDGIADRCSLLEDRKMQVVH